MKVDFKLSEKDRDRWGGDEWVGFDLDRLADLGYDRLNELERDLKRCDDTSIAKLLGIEWPEMSMLGLRGMMWLARQLSGLPDPAWPDFKPDIINATFKSNKGGDASPPAGGSSEPPSAGTAKTAKASTARSKKG